MERYTSRMRRFIQSPLIEIKYIRKRGRGGRGVFATQAIGKDHIIERVPCILVPDGQIPNHRKVLLSWYAFEWYKKIKGEKMACIALGYASIYNHSFEPNACYDMGRKDTMIIWAIRDIKRGEEITINYNGNPNSKKSVGFKVN